MQSPFDYPVHDPSEILYNLKWTLLNHIKYIVNSLKLFAGEFPNDSLPNEHFFDTLASDYNQVPAFGIEYIGRRFSGERADDLIVIRYVGRNLAIEVLNKCGVESEGRKLLRMQEVLESNFLRLSKENKLEIYNWDENLLNNYSLGNILFSLDLIESTLYRFNDASINSRQNSLDLTFAVNVYTS